MNLYNSFRYCSVQELGEDRWEAVSAINDSFHEMKVRTVVHREEGYKLGETGGYRIITVEGEMLRCPHDLCRDTLGLLEGLAGMELAPPVRKKIMEKVAGSLGCRQLADLVLEAVRGFIQAEFNKRGQHIPSPVERRWEFQKDVGGSCYMYSKL